MLVLRHQELMGPLLLGSLFDILGLKKMIAATFASSGMLLLVTVYLFGQGLLSAATQTIAWVVIIFFRVRCG
jgi:hypothetical protein